MGTITAVLSMFKIFYIWYMNLIYTENQGHGIECLADSHQEQVLNLVWNVMFLSVCCLWYKQGTREISRMSTLNVNQSKQGHINSPIFPHFSFTNDCQFKPPGWNVSHSPLCYCWICAVHG